MQTGKALQLVQGRLAPQGSAPLSATPGLDAQVLLAQILGRSRTWVMAHPEAVLTADQAQELDLSMARLEAGEPLPYVLGHWEFYSIDLEVTQAVLIPRPETEVLVEQALAWLQQRRGEPHGGLEKLAAVDVGTGSGCISIALARNLPGLRILASDLSLPALDVAKRNARRCQVDGQVFFVQSDLLPGLGRRLDLVCANLPYIPTSTLHELRVGQSEPWTALDGGPDGLTLISRLMQQFQGRMAPGGLALLEIEASQGQAVLTLARSNFPGACCQVLPDLAGFERVLRIDFQD